MKNKKFKKIIFKLAEMCNATECKDCFLSFHSDKCMLRHASLQDIAKGCISAETKYSGTVWIRLKDKAEFEALYEEIMGFLDSDGDYGIKIYLKENNSQSSLGGLMVSEGELDGLIQRFGEENVKLVMIVPDEILSYF